MSSLQDLLAEEGFRRRTTSSKPKHRPPHDDSVSLPIHVCRHRKIAHHPEKPQPLPRSNASSIFPSKRSAPKSSSSNPPKSRESLDVLRDEPAIDQVAVKAVISILGGYAGRFLKDQSFRSRVRETCLAFVAQRHNCSDDPLLTNMELGIDSIERLAENIATATKESRVQALQNSIRLLSIIASLNSAESRNGSTCGVANSHLSACAQLYLAIVYKIEKNDRTSARHLLQVFCDSPSLARAHLIPELWEHFFLPHLLHLKVWYNKEVENMSNLENGGDRQRRMKLLTKAYNDQMDVGTAKFALYYKEWLKVGGVKAPAVPCIDLPPRSSYDFSKRRSASMGSRPPSLNRKLYRTVFGHSFERALAECEGNHIDFFDGDGHFSNGRDVFAEEERGTESDIHKISKSAQSTKKEIGCKHRLLNELHQNQSSESDYLRFFMCRGDMATDANRQSSIRKNEALAKEPNTHVAVSDLNKATATMSSSESLADCENAITVVARLWLDSQGDPTVEAALSQESVIEGMLEIMFSSENDEVLELGISILAELISTSEGNRQIVLNSDPQLEILMRLLRNNSLFLKAAVLLYLLKPKAKQMLSPDWVPLVLRVLEYGGHLQTMFTVQCRPQEAVFYLLGQLLMGFDVDRNVENAKQVVLLGGLRLLVRQLELGDAVARRTAASFLLACIRADGSCRHYLATNIKKPSILELMLGSQRKASGYAVLLLIELVSLSRRTRINKFLDGLKNEGCLNAMHALLAYLHHAPIEQRPLIAAVLLQLDLLGDTSQRSVYREEVMDSLVVALNCSTDTEMVQEQSSRALLILGGRFSHTGKPSSEQWQLKQAGMDDISSDALSIKDASAAAAVCLDEEEKATEDWLRKVGNVLLTCGNKRFLVALSRCMANGIPCLARACLVTVAWMSGSIATIQNASIQLMAANVLIPVLLESLHSDRALEDRVLASLSLVNFARSSDCFSLIAPLEEEFVGPLRNLAHVTWTAKELLTMARSESALAINHLAAATLAKRIAVASGRDYLTHYLLKRSTLATQGHAEPNLFPGETVGDKSEREEVQTEAAIHLENQDRILQS
ncbi:hypothetical protein ACLOJK_020027 [Asimina triloba]